MAVGWVERSETHRLRRVMGFAALTPHPGSPHSGTMRLGQLGNVLPNGEDYRPHEVETMMQRLWAEYVAANPKLFR